MEYRDVLADGSCRGRLLPVTYTFLAEIMLTKHRGWCLVLVGGIGAVEGLSALALVPALGIAALGIAVLAGLSTAPTGQFHLPCVSARRALDSAWRSLGRLPHREWIAYEENRRYPCARKSRSVREGRLVIIPMGDDSFLGGRQLFAVGHTRPVRRKARPSQRPSAEEWTLSRAIVATY